MSIRAKTKRRVVILLVGIISVAAIATGGLYWRLQSLQKTNLSNRALGLEAYAKKKYPEALKGLSLYLGKARDTLGDLDARFAYAKSRATVETPDGRYLVEAKDAFQSYLQQDPNNVQAQRELLDLFKKLNYDPESVDLADKLLERFPNDLQALKRKAEVLHDRDKNEQALPLAEKINTLDPTDIAGQRLTYAILWATKAPTEKVLARAKTMSAEHPGDPRFEMLQGMAYIYARDMDAGRNAMRSASTKPAPDAEFVKNLAELLSQLGMFDECQQLLDRSTAFAANPQLVRQAIQLNWQNGRYAQVVERLKDLDPAKADSASALLAMKALSLYQLDNRADANAIVDALSKRTEDGQAVAWTTALQARFADPPLPPQQLVIKLQAARARTPRNGVFDFMLGEGYAQLGETELAMRHWRSAAEEIPGWSRPRMLIARALVATNRPAEALEEAKVAYELTPNQPATNITLATVLAAALEKKPDADQEKRLLEFVGRLQTAIPSEPETFPLYVSLLCRSGQRSQAAQIVEQAVAAGHLKLETLDRLSAINKAQKLGLDALLQQQQATTESGTPAGAFTQAMKLASSGKPADGLALLQAQANAAKTLPIEWKLALLTYREATDDAAAATDWVKLGNEYPNELLVQKSILRSAGSVWTNRPFVSETINRLKAITGDDGLEWRIARAKLLLTNTGEEKQRREDASAAAVILTEVIHASENLVEPRLLLARALRGVGNNSGAIEQLHKAVELDPGNTQTVFELVQLMHQEGQAAQTAGLIDRLATSPTLTADGRRRVAVMMADSGQVQRAVDVLKAHPEDAPDIGRNTLLAEFYRRLGKLDEATAIYTDLLNAPTTTATAIQSGADFFAKRRDLESAKRFLGRLDELKVRPGTKEFVLAQFNDHFGDASKSGELFQQAARETPMDSGRWKALVGFYMRHGQYDQACSAADEAIKNLPDDAILQALRKQAQAVQAGTKSADLQPLVEALAKDPASEALSQALGIIDNARKTNQNPAAMVAQLRQIADKNLSNQPIQLLTARVYASIGRYDEAGTLALRAGQMFPNDPEPSKATFSIFGQAGKWEQAKVAAREWRLRSLEDPAEADLALAEAQCRLGEAGDALTTLSVYATGVKAHPQASPPITVAYCKALVLSGRAAQAEGLLLPLVSRSPEWVPVWLDLAQTQTTPRGATEWAEKALAYVPVDIGAQYNLALTWYNLGQKFGDTSLYLKSGDILNKITAGRSVPFGAWLLLASVSELQGDYPAADKAYRQVLKLEPKNSMAQNNLAYLLLLRNSNLDEAINLSSQAVTSPTAPASFHDTLARLYAKTGNLDLALKSFTDALSLDPGSVEAMIGLADMQRSIGRTQEANITLNRIENLMKTNPRLSPMLQQELETVRKALR